MKNRNLLHSDNWETPPDLYEELDSLFDFDFDPCPLNLEKILPENDGLLIEWGERNFINPPYSRTLKEAFVKRAIHFKLLGKLSIMLLPVSTSTVLFHDIILPNESHIKFLRRRVPFIGINTKGEYVNWHLSKRAAPPGVVHVKNSGMHDSMLVKFDGRPQ